MIRNDFRDCSLTLNGFQCAFMILMFFNDLQGLPTIFNGCQWYYMIFDDVHFLSVISWRSWSLGTGVLISSSEQRWFPAGEGSDALTYLIILTCAQTRWLAICVATQHRARPKLHNVMRHCGLLSQWSEYAAHCDQEGFMRRVVLGGVTSGCLVASFLAAQAVSWRFTRPPRPGATQG